MKLRGTQNQCRRLRHCRRASFVFAASPAIFRVTSAPAKLAGKRAKSCGYPVANARATAEDRKPFISYSATVSGMQISKRIA